jgi:Tetratricopeptide repeat
LPGITLRFWFFFGGFAELLRGRTEEAITLLDKSLARNPSYGSAQLFMAAALSMNGQRTQASERATAFRARYPDYRTNAFEQLWLSRSSSAAYRAQIHPLFEKVCALGVAN